MATEFSQEEIEKHINSLIPEARKVLDEDVETRVLFAVTDRFIQHEKAKQILDYLELLLQLPRKPRMPGVLIYGDSGSGKTTLVWKFRELHPPQANPYEDTDTIPVLIVESPSEPNVKMLYNRILDEIGIPYRKNEDILEKEKNVKYYVEKLGIRMIIFDEFHNVLNGSAVQQRRVLSAIKSLTNQLWIPIVLVGTRDALIAVESEEETKRRFDPFYLPRWKWDKKYIILLKTIEETLPLKYPSYLWKNRKIAEWILNKSNGVLSDIIKLVRLGAREAILSGKERITLDILKSLPISDREVEKALEMRDL